LRALPTSMTMLMLPQHVLGPKYERWQRPRNSQGFRIGKSGGNPARTPDVAGVISLNRFLTPSLNIALKDTASCKDVYANLFRNMGKVKADVTCKWACAYVAP
jgi:hypothetical protein